MWRTMDSPRCWEAGGCAACKTFEVRRMGEGQLADQFQPMADALGADGYYGVISFESVYHPGDGDYEARLRSCIGGFKQHFG
jgi:hypothetical protein